MNLQIYDYDDGVTLKYETSNVVSATIVPDVKNIIELKTLWGYICVDRLTNPIDSYSFTLEGVKATEIASLRESLRLDNYGCRVVYPKTGFGLENTEIKRRGFLQISNISDEKYKYSDLSDVNRLVDIEVTFKPFSIAN